MVVRSGEHRFHPGWWTLILITAIAALMSLCSALFAGSFKSYSSVALISNRSGLVMESGAKVKMRGIEVGRVGSISAGGGAVRLSLELFPSQMKNIPANVEGEIKATTVFGAKYVELIAPDHPSPQHIAAGAVLHARNVSTEVNTVFQNLVGVLQQVDVAKLNATLSALADGVQGQGPRIGEATTASNQVLAAINPRMGTLARDFRSFKGFSDAYGAAARDILATLDAASTTSTTVTNHAADLSALLLNTTGFADTAVDVLAPNRGNLIKAINNLAPTTDLLMKYNPEITCTLVGTRNLIQADDGGYYVYGGGNGYSIILDVGLDFGDDNYHYPENLPIVAAKGGPGGKPGCGSLPDPYKNYPVRYLVTNTGWGTGLDVRPNPGLGHPCYADYAPVSRGIPAPASVRQCLPGPAPGPIPYPGAPPYGAPLYGSNGTPLYLGVPPPPPPPPAPPVPTSP